MLWLEQSIFFETARPIVLFTQIQRMLLEACELFKKILTLGLKILHFSLHLAQTKIARNHRI